jgi:predicted lactoylglutathione lyase
MPKKVIINLPVKNLDKSKAFFSSLGLAINPQLTDENATCFVINDQTFVALLSEPHFKAITSKDVAEGSTAKEVLLAIGAETREEVDELVNNAVSAGGSELGEPQDHGWIYGRTFADLDGHQWNIFYMNASEMPK